MKTVDEWKQDAENDDWFFNTLINHDDSNWTNVKFVEVSDYSYDKTYSGEELSESVIFTKDDVFYCAETFYWRNDHGERFYELNAVYPVKKITETIVIEKWVKDNEHE